MSSIIDPIIQVFGKRKIVVVTITPTAGSNNGLITSVNGLERINQVLGWSTQGVGTTIAGGIASVFTTGVNGVGVSLIATGNVVLAGVTAT
jgi:hypothetical protein